MFWPLSSTPTPHPTQECLICAWACAGWVRPKLQRGTEPKLGLMSLPRRLLGRQLWGQRSRGRGGSWCRAPPGTCRNFSGCTHTCVHILDPAQSPVSGKELCMEGSREREGGREGGMEGQRNRGTKGDAKERDLQSEVSCDSVRKKRAAATRRPRANQHAVTLTACLSLC